MKWVLGLAIGIAVVGTVGCGVDSGDTSTGGGGAGGSPCGLEVDPASGPVLEECGVWVSAGKGDDANPGTQDAPVATLAHAVELARKGTGHVYACAETWSDPLVLPGHVSLHGGFDCENDWAYLGAEKRSMLVTPPDEIALIVSSDGDGGEARITDFYIESAAAVKPGGSSIAVFVRDDVPLWIYRCEIVSGDAADGLNGTADDTQAPAGPPGNAGADACSAAVTKGGLSPETACEDGTASKGGSGGDSAQMAAADGAAGEPVPGNPEDGAGGLGEQNSPVCTPGKQGANGAEGAYGLGGLSFEGGTPAKGRLTVDGYAGVPGADGKPGAPGQGGGGGGATFGSAAVCSAGKSGGAAGGSGGAGGCGGKGGGGGQAGGSSIGIALRNKLGFFTTSFTIGNGGKGGDGAPGQDGGNGGAGGPGGDGAGTIKPGCAGGTGGAGGKGGWGGGGMGGSSLAIAVVPAVIDGYYFLGGDGVVELDLGEGGEEGQGTPFASDGRGAFGIETVTDYLNP